MKKKILALSIAVIMVFGVIPVTAFAAPVPTFSFEPYNTWTSSDGKLRIGFFDFDKNGWSDCLEIRTTEIPAEFSFNIPYIQYTENETTVINNFKLNSALLSGVTESDNTDSKILFSGEITKVNGFKSGDVFASATVSGSGTFLFGEGEFRIKYGDKEKPWTDYGDRLNGVDFGSFNPIVATPKPNPPKNLTAIPGDGQVTLSWDAPDDSGGDLYYHMAYNSTSIGGEGLWMAETNTSHTFTGLANGESFTFKVRSCNFIKESEPVTVTATPSAEGGSVQPNPPKKFIATPGDGQVTLTWNAPDYNGAEITGYQVVCMSPSAGAATWEIASSDTSHTFTGLNNGWQYAFRVRAINENEIGETALAKTVPTATPNSLTPPYPLGDIDGTDGITIFDALEVLKELVGMESLATGNAAALITPEAQDSGKPTIFDALEILKYLVGMESLVNAPTDGPGDPNNPDYITIRNVQYSTSLTELSIGETYYSNPLTSDEIEPLKYMKNLTSLELYSNADDISPLGELTKLESLLLAGCGQDKGIVYNTELTDISPLSELVNLTNLELYCSEITDISPISELTNITDLVLYCPKLTDISPVSGLTNITMLELYCPELTDISPLSELADLTYFYSRYSKIADLTPLSGLTKLVNINLFANQITDLTPLSGLTDLEHLNLQGNRELSDIMPLSGLVKLKTLNVRGTLITSTQANELKETLTETTIAYGEPNPATGVVFGIIPLMVSGCAAMAFKKRVRTIDS